MALFKLKPVEAVDFKSLVRPSSPNTYLLGPPDQISAAVDQPAPVFDCPGSRLIAAWESAVGTFPRMKELDQEQDGQQRTYVQRTAFLGFPDIITVRFMDLDEGKSTLALYSRSQYGYSDAGANRRRVRKLLSALTASLD